MPPRNSNCSDHASRVTRHPYTAPLARDDDPATSAAAADRVTSDGTVDTHELWIICVVQSAAPRGLTGKEIASRIRVAYRAPITHIQVMRRMARLLAQRRVFRRRDPRRAGKRIPYTVRDGQCLHYATDTDTPLFPTWCA